MHIYTPNYYYNICRIVVTVVTITKTIANRIRFVALGVAIRMAANRNERQDGGDGNEPISRSFVHM